MNGRQLITNKGAMIATAYFLISTYISILIAGIGTLFGIVIGAIFFIFSSHNSLKILSRSISKTDPPNAIEMAGMLLAKVRFGRTTANQSLLADKRDATEDVKPKKTGSFFKQGFLKKHPKIDAEYQQIKKLESAILALDDLTDDEKDDTLYLSSQADEMVEVLCSLDSLGKAQDEISTAHSRFAAIKETLDDIAERKATIISYSFNQNLFLEEQRIKQRIDVIHKKGELLLSRMDSHKEIDPYDLSNLEDSMVVKNLVDEHLGEIWDNYKSAKEHQTYPDRKFQKQDNPLELSASNKNIDVEQVVSELLDEIESYLSKVEVGVSSSQSSEAINELLENQLYFKSRNRSN